MQPIEQTLTEINALLLEANQRLLTAKIIEEYAKYEGEAMELLGEDAT